jgi:hypothetical protein
MSDFSIYTHYKEQQALRQLPEGLAVSGRAPPGTNVFDFLAISFCNSLPFLLLKSETASALSCHMKCENTH